MTGSQRRCPGTAEARDHSHQHHPGGVAQHQARRLCTRGAESHTNSDLAPAQGHRVGKDAVNSDRRKNERGDSKPGNQPQRQAPLAQRFRDRLFHGLKRYPPLRILGDPVYRTGLAALRAECWVTWEVLPVTRRFSCLFFTPFAVCILNGSARGSSVSPRHGTERAPG